MKFKSLYYSWMTVSERYILFAASGNCFHTVSLPCVDFTVCVLSLYSVVSYSVSFVVSTCFI